MLGFYIHFLYLWGTETLFRHLPSVTEQMKKITLIEYASNKLWR